MEEASITPLLLAGPAMGGSTTGRKKIGTEINDIIQKINETCNKVII